MQCNRIHNWRGICHLMTSENTSGVTFVPLKEVKFSQKISLSSNLAHYEGLVSGYYSILSANVYSDTAQALFQIKSNPDTEKHG